MADVDLVNGTPWANVDLVNGILKANIDYIMGGISAPAAGAPSGSPVAWWDANQITGYSDGEKVSPWLDMSGGGHGLYRTVADDQPTYKTGIQNGLPILRFDGVDDDLNTAAGDNFTWTQPTTIFIALKIPDQTGSGFITGGGNSSERQHVYHGNLDPTIQMHAGTNRFTTTDVTGNFEIIVARFDGASSWIRLDGVQDNIADPGSQPLGDPFFLGRHYGGTKGLSADIGEIIFYDGAEDPSANETYLADKWGITL
jgi:hypothetical protein